MTLMSGPAIALLVIEMIPLAAQNAYICTGFTVPFPDEDSCL